MTKKPRYAGDEYVPPARPLVADGNRRTQRALVKAIGYRQFKKQKRKA